VNAPRIEWPADQVKRVPIEKLLPYARNARVHTDAQIAQLAASIREWGWTIPVLVDETGALIAGHGRVLAARQLEIDHVPTMTARGWSEAKIKAYRIADNRLAESSSWDRELLAVELGDLRDFGADLTLAGFSTVELDSLLAAPSDTASEWQGMPEYQNESRVAYKSVVVHMKDQEAVDQFASLIGQKITEKTRFVWYPQAEIGIYIDKRYSAEDGDETGPEGKA
jgi:ParB-like nuclease domain